MKTVLFVDDDEAFREICRRIFEEEGYHVVLAEDGMQAIGAVKSESPDVAVVDVRMPRMSGFDVAEKLKRMDPDIPIIIYTANDEACVIDRRAQLASACVSKSSDFTELVLAISRVLRPAYRRAGFRFGLPRKTY